MAEAKLSGYKTAVAVAWASGQGIASLTDNEYTDLSDEINNSSDLNLYADVELVLASVAFTGLDSTVAVYLIPTLDGTNYPTWAGNGTTDEQENEGYFVGVVTTTGTTAAQRLVIRDISLPNGKYKVALRNTSNIAFAATGNTLKLFPHNVTMA